MSSGTNSKNIRLFGNTVIGVPLVYCIITSNTFESIRQFFHLNDNTLSNQEYELFKLKPIVCALEKKIIHSHGRISLCWWGNRCYNDASPHETVYLLPPDPSSKKTKISRINIVLNYIFDRSFWICVQFWYFLWKKKAKLKHNQTAKRRWIESELSQC